jgi:NADH-quinone oxidoreductase subunit K
LLGAAGVLFMMGSALPAGGLLALDEPAQPGGAVDPLLSGQVATIMLITIAAAEIGLALAVVLLIFRVRATSDLTAVRELGESSPTYTDFDETLDPAGGRS